MGELYRISFPNGKGYIGITAKTARARLATHLSDHKRKECAHLPLYRAIEKYGFESLAVETLAVANDWEYLCDMERAAIVAFGTRSPSGYNATDGGDGAPKGHKYRLGLKHSDSAKRKMSIARRGRSVHTDQSRAKIGAASKGNTYSAGLVHSESTKRKRAVSLMSRAPTSASGVRGVSFCRQTGKWRAHITVGRKMRHLGRFDSIDKAVAIRIEAERAEIARLMS